MNEQQRLEGQQVKTANPSDKNPKRITVNIFKLFTCRLPLKMQKNAEKKK